MRVQPNLKFLLIGGGEQDGLLRNLVIKLKLTRQVIFSGIVEFRELTRYMSLANVAISPLLISEVAGAAFPQKVLQYMAVGIPVVSTKLDGLYAAFGDKSGIIWALDPRDVTVKAIEVLSKNSLDIRTQTKLQIDSVSSLFTPERVTTALEGSLAEITNKGKVS
jgi:glycosyltransferase involved in cell wall biosynthesis